MCVVSCCVGGGGSIGTFTNLGGRSWWGLEEWVVGSGTVELVGESDIIIVYLRERYRFFFSVYMQRGY